MSKLKKFEFELLIFIRFTISLILSYRLQKANWTHVPRWHLQEWLQRPAEHWWPRPADEQLRKSNENQEHCLLSKACQEWTRALGASASSKLAEKDEARWEREAVAVLDQGEDKPVKPQHVKNTGQDHAI